MPNWYIAAGILSQTVWNHLHGFESDANIKDIDLVYFDPDTSYEAEDKYIQRGKDLFGDLQVDVEIRNQARVYLWYEDHFGIITFHHTIRWKTQFQVGLLLLPVLESLRTVSILRRCIQPLVLMTY